MTTRKREAVRTPDGSHTGVFVVAERDNTRVEISPHDRRVAVVRIGPRGGRNTVWSGHAREAERLIADLRIALEEVDA